MRLATAALSQKLDGEASLWGLDSSALVEAAARSCVEVFLEKAADRLPRAGEGLCVLAGGGHNAADALVFARILLFKRLIGSSQLRVVLHREPDFGRMPAPLRAVLESMAPVGARIMVWDGSDGSAAQAIASSRLVLDGLAGTGLTGPLRGSIADIATFCRSLRTGPSSPFFLAVDLPSGLFDGAASDMPDAVGDGTGGVVLPADLTLAIEPGALSLFVPRNRALCGEILPVSSVFPPALLDKVCRDTLLPKAPVKAEDCRFIASISPDDWKTRRGQLSVWAGDIGTAGAALLCARAAQAAGAGFVRLHVPEALYPSLAGVASGLVLSPEASPDTQDAATVAALLPQGGSLLAGPGWVATPPGTVGPHRTAVLEALFAAEGRGRFLVLDAGAVPAVASGGPMGQPWRFSAHTILTPHPGEFAALCALSIEALLQDPDTPLRAAAARHNAVIVLKGSVTRVAHPDGRLALLDGRFPALACAGSGDVLAGLIAALLSRGPAEPCDAPDFCFKAACLAVRLHLQAARELASSVGFFDPGYLVGPLSRVCADLFLPGDPDAR